ncbi:toxin-antitoxin system toxin DarT [Actinocorallia lasiicapitis]
MTSVFHITHIDNLRGIAAQGILCDRDSGRRFPVNSGHSHIKDRRAAHRVTAGQAGHLNDYAPFYFAPRSPMLYAINSGRVGGVAHGQRKMLHLVSSCEAIQQEGLPFVFTDGHATMKFSSVFTDLRDLDKIDWLIMGERFWHDTQEDNDRKRRRQAEFLVHRRLPWSLIGEIGVIDHLIAGQARELLGDAAHRPPVIVRPEWYY